MAWVGAVVVVGACGAGDGGAGDDGGQGPEPEPCHGQAAAYWTEEVVTTRDTGWHPDIAMESDGTAHVVYGDLTFGVTYARRDNGTFAPLAICSLCGESDVRPSIALDARGTPHFAYKHAAGIAYAVLVGSVLDEIVAVAGQPEHGDLALDPEGKAHIAHAGGSRHATNVSGTFVDEPVLDSFSYPPSIASAGVGTSIAAAGIFDGYLGIVVAWNPGGSWRVEPADLQFDPELALQHSHPEIALKANGDPVVAFLYVQDLFVATRVDGAWTKEMVSIGSWDCGGIALALDASDTIHLLFPIDRVAPDRPEGVCALHYATNAGGRFVVEDLGREGRAPAIAVGPSGTLHAIYRVPGDSIGYSSRVSYLAGSCHPSPASE